MVGVNQTLIPGLLTVELDLHSDSRGWFSENWQQEKMTAVGLPFFAPVQNNVSFNSSVGVTRGFHAEPWDKLVSVVSGRVFSAWVDLREGEGFGKSFTLELSPGLAVFVPRGVANSYQTLEPNTVYSYLVNGHWSEAAEYISLSLFDPEIRVTWPTPLEVGLISEKDLNNPPLSDVAKFTGPKTLIIGDGQAGKALKAAIPKADLVSRAVLDIDDPFAITAFDFSPYNVVVNTAAYTSVDDAQKNIGAAWRTNAHAVAHLAAASARVNAKFVHFSSDYVFDGTRQIHEENEPFAPLGVYGQSKAAGDIAAASNPDHLIIRTSWVVGDGHNFVQTMKKFDAQGIAPEVVSDQYGRPTFTQDLAEAVQHLLAVNASGTFNVTNDGPVASWYEIAQKILVRVKAIPVLTADFVKPHHSPRPMFSTLDLDKLKATGLQMPDWRERI